VYDIKRFLTPRIYLSYMIMYSDMLSHFHMLILCLVFAFPCSFQFLSQDRNSNIPSLLRIQCFSSNALRTPAAF
jgi:hypothetical protein